MSPQKPTPQPLTPDRTQKSPCDVPRAQQSLSLIDATPPENRNRVTCPRCDAWWTGLNTAHCAACHATFTGITAFDAHRTDAGRAYPCWGFPGTDTHWTNELEAK